MDAATGNERRPIFDYLLQSFTFNGSVCIYVSYFRMLSNAICSRVILRGGCGGTLILNYLIPVVE